MTFETKLTRDHYERFHALMIAGVHDGRIAQSHHPDFRVIVMYGIAIILFMAGLLTRPEIIGFVLIGGALGFCFSWWVSGLIQKFQIRQYRKKFAPQEDDPLLLPHIHRFGEQTIECRSEASQTIYQARKLRKLVEESELLLIFRSPREAIIYPKEQLPGGGLDHIHRWAESNGLAIESWPPAAS